MSKIATAEELDVEQGREMFNRVALKTLGMSGDEFVEQYEAGTLSPELMETHHSEIMELEILLPFRG